MKRALHTAGITIEISGVVLLLYCLFYVMRAQYFEYQQRQTLAAVKARALLPVQPRFDELSTTLHKPHPPIGSVLGWVEIPRLKLSTAILDGDSDSQFDLGAGHVPGTADPGQDGNFVVAAHRDTFFRNLRKVKPDDRIVVTTPSGSYDYTVEKTEIVKPESVFVMQAHGRPELTLITCYPFTYIGNAPERFIVHAKRMDTAVTSVAQSEPRP
jgi:sortase A